MQHLRPLSIAGVLLLLGLGLTGPGCAKVREASKKDVLSAKLLEGLDSERAGQDKQPAGKEDGVKGEGGKAVDRKIIYTAQIRLISDEFVKAREQLLQLVEDHKGQVIHSENRGAPGSPRYGEWKILVPVAKFKAFQEAVVKLGELQSSNLDSQDITEEFYDLQTRIKSREARLARLRAMYDKADKPADLVPIDREIDQVTLTIEREQGRLKLLSKLTEMTTVTVVIHERGAYVPPETATLGTKAGRTFWDSLAALGDFGQGLLLALIALVPWLPVIAVIVVPIWLLARRAKRAAAESTAQAVAPSGPAEPPQQPA